MKENTTQSSQVLGLVITDGVGYRNFILSDFPKAVQSSFKHIVIFSGLPKHVFKNLDNQKFTIVELPVFRETKKQWFWRKLREVAHLRMFPDNDGIQDNLKMNYRKGWRPNDILVKIIYVWTKFNPSEKSIQRYEQYRNKSLSKTSDFTELKATMQHYPVDLLFFTHQRPPFIAVLTNVAGELNIPTATFIFSWDNLASKGRMAATFDHYLVWSYLMLEELLEFYKNITGNQVKVAGTPQFEPYILERYYLEEDWFYHHFNLQRNKKTIFYSCADETIGANDPIVIKAIAQALQQGQINNAQLLVRTSPAEDPKRFEAVRTQFPEIHWNHPEWRLTRENHPEPWSQRIPEEQDIAQLKAILQYSDLNVNMCSTMSLDFMIFDKPVINTVFGNLENGLYNDQRFLEYSHYKRVVHSGAVTIAKNKQELIDQINFSLENPTARLQQQRDLVKLQISKPLEGTSKRISSELAKLISR